MIVGCSPKSEDLAVNVCKKKHVSNMRASGSDEALRLVPYRRMSLEECLEFLGEDELLEVTPKNLRLRKRILNNSDRDEEHLQRQINNKKCPSRIFGRGIFYWNCRVTKRQLRRRHGVRWRPPGPLRRCAR